MQNAGLDEAQAGIKNAGRISITSDMQTTPPLWQKAKGKEPFVKMKEESEKAGLKLNIQKSKIMASGPISLWQVEWKQCQTLFFWAPKALVGCSPWGRYESDTTERLYFHFSLSCIGEGNGSPLQYSCLENPRDGGAWWAAIYGVAESDTTEVT